MSALPNNEYPTGLIGGGPLLQAYEAIKQRLQMAFPKGAVPPFTHQVVPPRMSPPLWKQLTDTMPMVGLGWASWNPGTSRRRAYTGDAVFVLFLATRNPRVDWLLTGDSAMPGVFGMAAVATAFLHGWTIPAVRDGQSPLGTCSVRAVTGTDAAEWVNDDVALVALEIVVPDVSLDGAAMQAELNDFLQLGVAWQFGEPLADQVDQTINVRGDA